MKKGKETEATELAKTRLFKVNGSRMETTLAVKACIVVKSVHGDNTAAMKNFEDYIAKLESM